MWHTKAVRNEALIKPGHDLNQRGFYSSALSGQSGTGASPGHPFHIQLPNQRHLTPHHVCRTDSALEEETSCLCEVVGTPNSDVASAFYSWPWPARHASGTCNEL